MKKVGLALLAVCLLLGGCGVIRETNEIGEPVPVSTLNLQPDEQAYRVQKSAVYFYNEASDTLTAEIRNLVISQDENPARAAIENLLEGPYENSQLTGVAPKGMTLSFIEYSRNVANVYLSYGGEVLSSEQEYILEAAITNTVTDLLEVSYVCIFYNGLQYGFSGKASAPLQKQTGSISEAYNQTKAKYIGTLEPEETPEETSATEQPTEQPAETPLSDNGAADQVIVEPKEREMQTVLYFVSEDGGYILPEVRTISYLGEEYAVKIFKELMAGPKDTAGMKRTLPADFELLSPPLINGDTLHLSMNMLPGEDDYTSEDYLASYASFVYTITGFMPGIKTIDISVLGKPISEYDNSAIFSDGIQRDDFYGYIGSSAPIYFMDKNSDLLLKVQRTMEQSATWSAQQRINEIFRGPVYSDIANAWPVVPAGVTEEDILSVKMYEDTVYVDLSQNFKDACEGYSAKNEMLLVYSFVNTLASMDGINKVQFLIEGKQEQELAGTLCISDPFLMNYGIIKQ